MPTTMRHFLLSLALLTALLASGCRAASRDTGRPAPPPVDHAVVAGETISQVAEAYGVTVAAIVKANGLRSRSLHAGQRLVIPGGHAPEPVAPAAPEPVVAAPVQPAAPATDWYVPRTAWAQRAIILSRTKPMGGVPTRITVHHSGDVGDAAMAPRRWLNEVDDQHMRGVGKAEPWACIGYHFIISADGQVFEGRPLPYQGAHAGWDEVNRLNIGICMVGNFDVSQVPGAQREALLAVLDRLCEDYHIARSQVFGHNHFKSTDCPGRHLVPVIEAFAHHASAASPNHALATVLPAQP